MPTYEFRCPNGHEFEHFYRKISDAQMTLKCPVCGEVAQRLVSAGAGLVFKGSGFYITDYGKDGKKNQRAAPTGSNKAEKGAGEPAAAGSGSESASGSATTGSSSTTAPDKAPAPGNAATPTSPPKSKPARDE